MNEEELRKLMQSGFDKLRPHIESMTVAMMECERDKSDFKPKPLSAYNLLWHPETNPLLKQVHLKGKNSDGEDYEEDVTAIDTELIRQACAVHLYVKAHREELSKYNPSNGWGSYDNLLKCSGEFLLALLDIPAEDYDKYFLYCWT